MGLPFDNFAVTAGTQQIVQDELVIDVDGELRFVLRRVTDGIFKTFNEFTNPHL